MTLTGPQRECVEARGQDICVVAGPGSGKTRVLIERFRWLVESDGLDPRRILAITFTEKAATEIKRRLVGAFAARPDLREEIERAWVSTIHGFCNRLLKEHAVLAGVDPEFVVLDQDEADAGLEEAVVETLDGLFSENPGALLLLLDRLHVTSYSGGRQPDLAGALKEIYAAIRVAGRDASKLQWAPSGADAGGLAKIRKCVREYLASAGGGSEAHLRRVEALERWLRELDALDAGAVTAEHFQALGRSPFNFRGLKPGNPFYDAMMPVREDLVPAVQAGLIERYNANCYRWLAEAVRHLDATWRRAKRKTGALDFADLEEIAIRLLESEPALAERVRSGFDAILMDELQDTNPLQWRLVNLLRRRERFFAVGDVNQSIYGFRHAAPGVFREFRRSVAESGHKVHELRENHRSRPEALAAVSRIVEGAAGVEPHCLEDSGKFAPRPAPGVEMIAAAAATSEEARELEAAWIARRIAELKVSLVVGAPGKERPAEFSDFAVLSRALDALEPVRQALVSAGIPALVAGGRGFFETREVRDLTHWLAVLANPGDQVAMAGLLRSPLAGLSDESLLRLRAAGGLEGGAALEEPDRTRLAELRERLARLAPLRDSISPDRLAAEALDGAGYLATLPPHSRANVEKFLALLSEIYAARPRSLRETLNELRRLRAARREAEAPPGESANAVRLMTIHKAKGLEFPVVFVISLQRSKDASEPPVCFDPAAGLGARWRDPAGKGGLGDPVHRHFSQERAEREKAEENRILYVAMTRAEEHLVLSAALSPKANSAWLKLVEAGLAPVEPRVVSTPPEPLDASVEAPAETVEEVLPQPEVSGQYDSTASVTSIALFRACPRRYYLGRYLGLAGIAAGPAPANGEEPPESEPASLDAAEFGTQVHQLLAGEPVPDPHPEAVALARSFECSRLGQRAARAPRAGRESGFVIALEDVVLRGQIDLWFEEDGKAVLVDYKTDRITAADAARLEPYRRQLQIYALAMPGLTGLTAGRAYLHLLRTGESVDVDLSQEALVEARLTVREFREAQDKLEFRLREGDQCERCGFYRGACPAGQSALP